MDLAILLQVLGGLGLFIYGMFLLTDSLKKLSLGFLKKMLESVTSNRIKSLLVGTFVTSIIQSSSATSVILIGFLNIGIITLVKALPVIIGANIGTTITAQLIALKLTSIAPLFIFIGALIFFFMQKNKHKRKGLAILGFGILFLGLATMSSAVKPLKDDPATSELFLLFSENPLLAILAGLIVTIILQSSSTTIGIVIALAAAGLIGLPAAIYFVLGDNIGTCVTAIIASIGGTISSKRLALGHTLFNIIGTAIAIPLVPIYLAYIPLTSGDISVQIANTHTIFNVVNALIFLPIIPLYAKLLEKLIPGKDYERKDTVHLDKNLLNTPTLAIRAVSREQAVMVGVCKGMLSKARKCLFSFSHKLSKEVDIDEQSVDTMQHNITQYLVEITKKELSEKNSKSIPTILHNVNDVERIGDYCEGICKLAERLYEHDIKFSSSAKEELNKLFDITNDALLHAKKTVENEDLNSAQKVLKLEIEIKKAISEFRHRHLKRLESGKCRNDAGLVYSDILIFTERINAHLANIAEGVTHIAKNWNENGK
ncbi:MAG: Na/Pi cotransporter family protein [Candidatus Micrarchaeota archaeon]